MRVAIRIAVAILIFLLFYLLRPLWLLPKLPPTGERGLCSTCHWDKKDIPAHSNINFQDGNCLQCHNPHTHFGKPYLPVVDSCLICHFEFKQDNFSVHKPVALKQCASCHTPHKLFEKPSFTVPMPQLCNTCHYDDMAKYENPVGHMPYEKRQCMSCHEPHSSPNPTLFRQELTMLCQSCHRQVEEWRRPIQHLPYEQGTCLDCHTGHASAYKGLIKTDQIRLCYTCHYDRNNELSRPIKHEPYGAGRCTDCHEPHSSAGKNLLPRRDYAQFCYTCHTDIGKESGGGYSHADAFKADSCKGCHEHHSADAKFLLRTTLSGNSFCLTCHDFPNYETAHFELRCYECHNIHGSRYPYLLKLMELDLCSRCHQGLQHQTTNHPVGEPYIDVLRNRTMLCTSCHGPHGTRFVKMTIRGKNDLCMPCHDEVR